VASPFVTISQTIDSGSGVGAGFTVDVAELRTVTHRLAAFGDALDDARGRSLMSQASRWGSVEALESGQRFRDRFRHLLAGLAGEASDAEHHLRQTATAYEMADENAHTALRHLGEAR
jgi:uncharacterized protein YceH (UPF0502 family)